jgi:hypothetical protein
VGSIKNKKMKIIEEHIKKAKEALINWQKEKDSFADDFKLRDFASMTEHSSNLLEIIENVVSIFYYEPLTTTRVNDYRTKTRIKNKAIMLRELADKVKKAEETANIPKFKKLIDKSESLMLATIKSAEMIASKQRMKEVKKEKTRTYKRKTQKEEWKDWKKWVETETFKLDPFSTESNVFRLKETLIKMGLNAKDN